MVRRYINQEKITTETNPDKSTKSELWFMKYSKYIGAIASKPNKFALSKIGEREDREQSIYLFLLKCIDNYKPENATDETNKAYIKTIARSAINNLRSTTIFNTLTESKAATRIYSQDGKEHNVNRLRREIQNRVSGNNGSYQEYFRTAVIEIANMYNINPKLLREKIELLNSSSTVHLDQGEEGSLIDAFRDENANLEEELLFKERRKICSNTIARAKESIRKDIESGKIGETNPEMYGLILEMNTDPETELTCDIIGGNFNITKAGVSVHNIKLKRILLKRIREITRNENLAETLEGLVKL